MARKGKKHSMDMMAITATFKPPSPNDRMRTAADIAARDMIEASPKTKKMRDAISRAVLAAGKKVLGKTSGGTIG